MKVKLLSAFLFFAYQFSFSQTVKGKTIYNNYAVQNVEIINATTKMMTVSKENGNFEIVAKDNDILVFISKEHQVKKLILNSKLFTNNELIVELTLKAEELSEVVITNMPSIKLSSDAKYEQSKLDKYAIENAANALKVGGVYMGGIENGMDFMRIGKMIGSLFRKDKKPSKKAEPTMPFIDFAKSSCDERYFLKTLNLKEDEIDLFLEFCDADPRSKKIAETQNILSVMDFLFEKNNAFKKL